MKKHLIIIGIVAILITIGLSGCQENRPLVLDKDRFVGTWIGSVKAFGYSYNVSLSCVSNGTFYLGITVGNDTNLASGTWEIKDNLFFLNGAGNATTYNYIFSNDDKSLTLTLTTADVVYEFTKQ